ncbi:hypothetical protein [Agrobacterium vitis]|uniref:hypothetical protein n=1 Tax=Agrobacterium vitis TaxID=373 RepID=UPI003D286D73
MKRFLAIFLGVLLATNMAAAQTATTFKDLSITGSSTLKGPVNTEQTVVTGNPGTQMLANNNYIGSFNANCGTSFCVGWADQMTFGGPNSYGGYSAGYDLLYQNAPTASGNTNANYVARTAIVRTATGDGGTNLTTSARGAYFGIGPECVLLGGAVNVLNCTAGEFDVAVNAGATVKYKSLSQFSSKPDDAVAGSAVDTMLWLYDQSSATNPNHRVGILFGTPDTVNEWPITATGTLIGAEKNSGEVNAGYGVDFRQVTFARCSFASLNFCVDGGGGINAQQLVVNRSSPQVMFYDTSGGTDTKRLRLIQARGTFHLQTGNDAGTTYTDAYEVSSDATGPKGHTWSTSTSAGTSIKQMTLNSSGELSVAGRAIAPATISSGVKPTSSGTCVAGSFIGGATAGGFTTASTCTTGQTIVLNFSVESSTGWACHVTNTNHPTDSTYQPIQSAYTVNTATFSGQNLPQAGDKLLFSCQGF